MMDKKNGGDELKLSWLVRLARGGRGGRGRIEEIH